METQPLINSLLGPSGSQTPHDGPGELKRRGGSLYPTRGQAAVLVLHLLHHSPMQEFHLEQVRFPGKSPLPMLLRPYLASNRMLSQGFAEVQQRFKCLLAGHWSFNDLEMKSGEEL